MTYDKWWRELDSELLTRTEGKVSVTSYDQGHVKEMYEMTLLTPHQVASRLLAEKKAGN